MGLIPVVGNTVDVENAPWNDTIGESGLTAVLKRRILILPGEHVAKYA